MAFIDEIKNGIDNNKINNEDLIDLYCGGNITMDDLLKALEYYYTRDKPVYYHQTEIDFDEFRGEYDESMLWNI